SLSSRVSNGQKKALCISRYGHLPGCGMANLAKTMPFARCPPAFVRSHHGGLFSPQTSKKSRFYANRSERQNGFLAECAKRATPQGQCRASRARTDGGDGSARRSYA